MKSLALFIGILWALLPAAAEAQRVTCYEYTTIAEPDGYEDDLYGVLRAADNGAFLVGSTGTAWPYYASYIIDATTGVLTPLSAATGEPQDFLYLQDVTDDGMMVGAHTVPATTAAGEAYNCWVPCVMFPDSTFVDLPFPDDYPVESFQGADGYADVFYVAQAKRVAPDGRVILGQMMLPDTIVREGEEHTGNYFEPWLWYFDPATGECLGTKHLALPYESVNGFIPYDMSDDGTIIVGRWTDDDGDAEPAMAYSDDDGDHLVLLRTAQGVTYWRGGCASCIDDAGNIYYVYPDDYNYDDVYSAKYNIYTGETTEYGLGVVVCGTEGLVVGMAAANEGPCVVFEGDTTLDLSQMERPENISDDGTLIAGAGIGYTTYGTAYNYPSFITIEYGVDPAPDPAPDGIQSLNAAGGRAEIYTLTGQRRAATTKGVNIINGKKVIIR